MRRFVILLALIALTASAWAAPMTIVFMQNGLSKYAEGEDKVKGYPGLYEKLIADFEKENPGVKVNMVTREVNKGSLTFDAMLAAGNPPDIWFDAGSYHVKYMTDDYALDLSKYMDLSQFQPGLLNLWKVNGKQYAVPVMNIATGMAINLDMLKKVGYELPPIEKWTTDEFLVLAAKLKAAGIPATCIQIKGGMNTWTNIWLRAFGATMFKTGDFSKVAINTPEAIKGLDYIKAIIDNGYTTPPLETNDDDFVELFTTGKVAAGMMQNGHTDYWVPEQVKQGKLDKEFAMTFIEFPHAANVKHTPVYGYQTTVLAKKNKDEAKNKMIGKFVQKLSGYEAQWQYTTYAGAFPTLKDFNPAIGAAGKPSYKAIAALAPVTGVYQEFPYGDKGKETGRLWNVYSEQWARGKMSAKDFLSTFEKEANAVLK
jgi:multiple sugar transport system substrate-binding protein